VQWAVLSLIGLAAPPDFRQIAAEATWLAHVDVDAIRASLLAQKVYQKHLHADSKAEIAIQLLRIQFGIDLSRDLHGITLYGRKIGKNEGVLLVHAQLDREILLKRAREAPDHAVKTYRGYEIHCWTDGKGKRDEHPVMGTFFKPTVLVFALTLGELTSALDVLDGRSPSLAGKGSPLAAPVPSGAAVVARAVGLANAELPFKSPLVTQSESFDFAVGENQGEAFAEATLTVKSAQIADRVRSILGGLRAMAELQWSEDQDALRLIGHFKVRVVDKAVLVQFRAPANDVWTQIEKDWSRARPNPVGNTPRSSLQQK